MGPFASKSLINEIQIDNGKWIATPQAGQLKQPKSNRLTTGIIIAAGLVVLSLILVLYKQNKISRAD